MVKLTWCGIMFLSVTALVRSTDTSKSVKELPYQVLESLATVLVQALVIATGDCSNATDVSSLDYWLYTRNNPNNPKILRSPNDTIDTKPIFVLIHGWGGNPDIDYIHVIKKAYLKRYDCNVISINYSEYASKDYSTAYCHVPTIGINAANFICAMSSILNISLSSIHIIGHSMGAQVAGFIGSAAQEKCGTIGRITGLDPAGPLYQFVDKSQRLDQTDADFVDIIHTNQGMYGYIGDCGHVDFYPNCGYVQAGCLNKTIEDGLGIFHLSTYILCNHQRSCYLFAESINNDGFYASSCVFCGTPLCFRNVFGSKTYMGESCRTPPMSTRYVLRTNSKSPYALGPKRSSTKR